LHTRKANIRTFTGVTGVLINLIALPLFGVALYWHHRRLATEVINLREQRRATVLAKVGALESKGEQGDEMLDGVPPGSGLVGQVPSAVLA
jgi:high-affinity Fe2+/Pb2+ permease